MGACASLIERALPPCAVRPSGVLLGFPVFDRRCTGEDIPWHVGHPSQPNRAIVIGQQISQAHLEGVPRLQVIVAREIGPKLLHIGHAHLHPTVTEDRHTIAANEAQMIGLELLTELVHWLTARAFPHA